MGNLIKDYWTYEYKEKNYFGIIEVIKGKDLAQDRSNKKYETHIEKALDYTLKHDTLSHMSIQTYCTWLKDKPSREDNEQKYYPFVLEFESKARTIAAQDKEYNDVVLEVAVCVQYLTSEFSINRDDITVMINNSKSIYIFVNPKSFLVKPDKDLHKIYTKMYEYIKKDLGLKYVDESIVSSGYKLMKTPNTFYKGGYFVWITIDELMQLLAGGTTKEQLTRKKRSLNKDIPGMASIKAVSFYNKAQKAVKYGYSKIDKCTSTNNTVKCEGTCIKYMQERFMEKGYRNFGLVSIGIYLKSIGYTKEEVEERLTELSLRWGHDENGRAIKAKVNSIFRKNYKFSCTYARNVFADMDIENMCSKCPYNKNKGIKRAIDGFEIDSSIINSLWANKASTRHYLLYLKLVKENLFNKQFIPADKDIDNRTLREFCKYALLVRKKDGSEVNITYVPSKKVYTLPEEFFNETVPKLGESIKQYLKLFVKGFKGNSKYMLIRSSMKNIMNELEYKDESSVYKLFGKLKDIGLLQYFNRTSSITLYYTSYKVININDLKEDTDHVQEELKVVGQLNIFDMKYDEFRTEKECIFSNKKYYRGSSSPPKNSG